MRLEAPASKVGLKPGMVINGWAFTQHGGTVYWDRAGVVSRTPQNGQTFASQSAWEQVEKANSKSKLPPPLRTALKADPRKRSDAQKQELRDYCKGQISHQKIPRYFQFVESYPLTGSGKVQKLILREQAIKTLGLEDVVNVRTA